MTVRRLDRARTRLLAELALVREIVGTAGSAEVRAITRSVDRLDRQLR